MYVCIPASSSSTARNTPYILTAVPNKVAMEMVNGMLRVDSSSPYHAIVPSAQGTVGYDGRRYACDCQPIQPPQTARTRFKHKYKQKQRITTADLDAFNSTIVQCIAASQATSQQITELTNVWLTCVAQAQNGRLGDSWFIAGIFFIITTGVLAIVLAMTCIKLSYETSLQKEEAEMQTKEVQPLVKPPPPIQQSIQPVSNKKLHW
jgi:hypothetical protein